MKNTNLRTVFKVIGFEIKDQSGNFMESCAFWVYAKDEKEALKKAKAKGVKKKYWQTVEVIEEDKKEV